MCGKKIDPPKETHQLTINDFENLVKWAELHKLPRADYCVTFSYELWKKARDEKCCEYFTDEEIGKAKNGGYFKTGWVVGIGVCHMYVDGRYDPKLFENNDYTLTPGYMGDKSV